MKNYFYLLILFFIFSCTEQEVEYEYMQRVVKAKTVDVKNGNTNYNVAFTDGSSDSFSFGSYTKYEVGDTVCSQRAVDFFGVWYNVDCNKIEK